MTFILLIGMTIGAMAQDLTFNVNGVTFKMKKVEGGTFTMGATDEQLDEAADNEKPAHSVTLSDFYMGETEVTQALWKAVMGEAEARFYGDSKGDNLPAINVPLKIEDFISKLNTLLSTQLNGKIFSLPTEAEWEYAARGGKKSKGYKYSGSNTIDEVAWYDGNSGRKIHPVAQKQANELGLFDMSGNAQERTSDDYLDYSDSAQTDPWPHSKYSMVFTSTDRGGNAIKTASDCRVSSRFCMEAGDYQGFRLKLR